MKINILLIIGFISIIFYSFSGYFEYDLIGCTELNGNGCVCHNLQSSPEVNVWVEGPDTLMQGQTGLYRMYLAGGPAIAGGYNVAVRFGVLSIVDSLSKWDYRTPYELTQAFPLPFANTTDTIYWDFAFTASDSSFTDTVYSCGLSTNWDTIPDYRDLWAFGPKYPVTIIEQVPVELISFKSGFDGNNIELLWSTATEQNNSGFYVERSSDEIEWINIGFIAGHGNSTEPREYGYQDTPSGNGVYFYRLRQTDYNGSFTYSPVISEMYNIAAEEFQLMQNFPNPFNPSTTIKYNVPAGVSGLTTLKIYDMSGSEIAVLINEVQAGGNYEVEFKGESFASGVYIYTLQSGNYIESKKLILMK
jgi:hypothetical protein